MTGVHLLGAPTIAGKPLVRARRACQRHVTILNHGHPTDRFGAGAAPASGSAYSQGTSTSNVLGGPGHFWWRGVGSWVEWKLGLLDCDRSWEFTTSWWFDPTRGVVQLAMDGVPFGATIDQYGAAGTAGGSATRTWVPPAGAAYVEHVLRATVTAAGTGGGTYGGFAAIYGDRLESSAAIAAP